MPSRSLPNSPNKALTSRSRTKSFPPTRSRKRSTSRSSHQPASSGPTPQVSSSSQNPTSQSRRRRTAVRRIQRRPASPRPNLPVTWDADLTNYLAHMRRQSEAVQDPAVSSGRRSPARKRRRLDSDDG